MNLIIILISILLKLIAAIFAIKNKLRPVTYYLLGNIFLDITSKLFNHYSNDNIILFNISIFLYIANASWLMFCSGAQSNNKPICYASVLALGSVFVICLIAYSYSLLLAFYAASALISLSFLIINLFKKPSFNTGILMMLNIGCLMEVFIVSSFGPQYYFLVNICNIVFYLAIICAGAMSQKYERLLEKLLQ